MNKKNTTPCFSMTGYGKGSAESQEVSIEVELKSVNHRYLDISCRLPRCFQASESEIRKALAQKLKRGRIDVYVNRTATSESSVSVSFNRPLFNSYFSLAQKLCTELSTFDSTAKNKVIIELLRNREIASSADPSRCDEDEKEVLFKALTDACDDILSMREAEGSNLREALLIETGKIRSYSVQINNLSSASPAELKTRLEERLKDLYPSILEDEGRLYQEAALLADKTDISEELVRIESHLELFEDTLGREPHGRKLDFIAQELLREFNTISSKTQHAQVQSLVVDAKVAVEKLKEQVQNVE